MSTGQLIRAALATVVMSVVFLAGCSLMEGTRPTPSNGNGAIANTVDWYLSIINSGASDRTRASAAMNLSLAYTRSVTPPDTEKAYKYMRMGAELKGEGSLTPEERERLMLLKNIADLRGELAESRKAKNEVDSQMRNLNEAIDKLEELQMEHEMKRRQVK